MKTSSSRVSPRIASTTIVSSTIAVFVLALAIAPLAHAAATANFQGQCNWNASHTQYTCTFDTTKPPASPSSCPGSFIWKYQWDFDDGSTLLTGNTLVSHTFVDGPERVVSEKVICWSGETATRARHVCNRVGTPGCIQINGLWY